MSDKLRHVGAQMATVLFNLSQGGNLPAETRDLLRDLQRQWDEATKTPEPNVIGWHVMNDSGWSDITDSQDIADQWVVDGFIVTPLVAAPSPAPREVGE